MDKKLKPVPKRIRCGVGDDFDVQERIENFLEETRNHLEDRFGKSPNFEIRTQQMQNSDNRLTYLIYKEYCVAGAFGMRTEYNDWDYVFFRDLSLSS